MPSLDPVMAIPLLARLLALALQALVLRDLFYRNTRIDDRSRMIWATINIRGNLHGAATCLVLAR